LGHRFGNHRGVMLGEPVLEERIRHADGHCRAVFAYETRRLEPGVKAVPVDLRFDASQHLFPKIHNGLAGPQLMRAHRSRGISTVFSTVVENFGERPNVHAAREALSVAARKSEAADSNTVAPALTLREAVR